MDYKQEAERLIDVFRFEPMGLNDEKAKACAAICCQEKLKLLQKLKEDFDFASDLDSYATDQQKVLEYIKQL